jgi:uncharacterized protein (DUF2062 family)
MNMYTNEASVYNPLFLPFVFGCQYSLGSIPVSKVSRQMPDPPLLLS